MGCFLACFGSSKNRKHRKPVNRILPRDQLGSYEPLKQTLSLKQDNTESPIFSPLLELKTGLGDFSESFFSVESRARISATSIAEKEVNSSVPLPGSSDWELKKLGSNWNARDRSKYVHSVLNPVENLTQWKTLKARATPPLKHQKENLNIEQETQRSFTLEPGLNLSPFNSKPYLGHSKPPNQEIAVDASLSNWLISSQTTPITKTSTISVGTMSLRSKEDRPILGALTVEELKKLSASSCPRRSPSRIPEDKPILGTVGGYWSHAVQAMDSNSGSSCEAIPNTTSKYREYKKVIWKSTPFQNKVGESYEQRKSNVMQITKRALQHYKPLAAVLKNCH
ncbi:hypothetical protein HHK36_020447 [Tetracentron sinense]|uniref:Uncharacterized protein n=1 Tax=Tetracentron sinense TaxID=13715 RepID=A0A834YV53_TETSI|nr:hypothetical protein HHK36_020447 [Tetracentron sinense]